MTFLFFALMILASGFSVAVTLAHYWHVQYDTLKAKEELRRQRLEAFMHGEIDEEVERVFRE